MPTGFPCHPVTDRQSKLTLPSYHLTSFHSLANHFFLKRLLNALLKLSMVLGVLSLKATSPFRTETPEC